MALMRTVLCAALVGVSAASVAAPATPVADVLVDPVISREDRIVGLVTVYTTAKQHFAYFDQVPKLDWDAAFKEHLPLAEKNQSLHDYYRVLQKFVALLNDAHTSVDCPADVSKATDVLPLRLDVVEGKWVVIERSPVKEVLAEDIPPGSVVMEIDGAPPIDYYRERFFPYMAAGTERAKIGSLLFYARYPAGKPVALKLRYPDGTVHSRTLRASRSEVNWTPAITASYKLRQHRDPLFAYEKLPGDVLHVRYGSCNSQIEERFCKFIESLVKDSQPKALILDLRGNHGGSTPARAIQHLISKPIPWASSRTRWSVSYFDAGFRNGHQTDAQFLQECKNRGLPGGFDRDWYQINKDADWKIEPAEIHYDGPLYILTDGETASAAEDFVVLLHGTGRATVCGEPTMGETGQPITADLPGGGSLRVCTMQMRCADGTEFVHKGYQPDVPLMRTIRGISEGRDELLEALLARVRSTLK